MSDGSTAPEWVATGSVTVRVPGKVNLYLAVGDRRDDGYHELTTVFHAVSLLDEVTVRNSDTLSLEVTGEGADSCPSDERNLAWQAAELMAEHVGRSPDVEIAIEKSIPVAGGMAGRQRRRGRGAGRDEQPVGGRRAPPRPARAGRPAGQRRAVRVARWYRAGHRPRRGPRDGVGAHDVSLGARVLGRRIVHRSRVRRDRQTSRRRRCPPPLPPRLAEPEPLLAALAAGDADELAPLLGNDLQAAAISLDPSLRRTLRAGTEAGALAGIVSGSGPTCAFLCSSAASAIDVGTQLAGAGVCRTVRVASGPVQGARVVPAPTRGM